MSDSEERKVARFFRDTTEIQEDTVALYEELAEGNYPEAAKMVDLTIRKLKYLKTSIISKEL